MSPETSAKAAVVQTGVARAAPQWSLSPARDILVEGHHFRAASTEPWLRVEQASALAPGSIVQIRYSTNYYDEPVRPIVRFWRGGDVYQDHLMPAPYEGTGIWIGRIPIGLSDVWISPAAQNGPFDFVIESITPVSWRVLLGKALSAPRRMFYAVAARLVGLHDEADLNLRWALGSEPMANHRSWKAERRGPVLATPRTDWSQGPRITLVIRTRDAAAASVDVTCRSIVAQSYPHWRVVFLDPPTDGDTGASAQVWLRDSRFHDRGSENAGPSDLSCHLTAGDALEPHALACFVEHFARRPDQTIAYADDIAVDALGGETPRFKPDWSPTLYGSFPYVGRAVLFRETMRGGRAFDSQNRSDGLVHELLDQSPCDGVGHVRRALFRFPDIGPEPVPENARSEAANTPTGSVTLIIPTRDRADLLEPCLRSILDLTTHDAFDILVIDNDSRESATQELFKRFSRRDPRVHVVQSTGPFNFAAICNKAVEYARGDYLLFLNNDTTIITPDWIEKLQSFASRPDVGAVGARLLFPNGRVQHAGLVLGMGGVVGHFGAHAAPETPGWLNGNHLPHETSAVTGACLMVEKSKFLAVGGFDATYLPIDLNDVDLCLRLAERGWRTICDTRAELVHHESASRGGGGLRLQRVYQRERAYFSRRWRKIIQDDPFFSPALSLYAYSAQLW